MRQAFSSNPVPFLMITVLLVLAAYVTYCARNGYIWSRWPTRYWRKDDPVRFWINVCAAATVIPAMIALNVALIFGWEQALLTNAQSTKSYYSPVDEAALAKDPSVKISQEIDHMEITYSLPCEVGNCISRVVQDRWEDGSGFSVFAGQTTILRLNEASPYWGYRQGAATSLFFVDYPPPYPGVEKLKYSELVYNYLLLARSETGSKSYNCTLNFPRMKGYIPSSLTDRQADPYSPDPILLLISKFLSERGTDPKLDGCRTRSIQ